MGNSAAERDARIRVVGLASLVFLILCSYAIARPAVESIFLTEYGGDSLPWVWLAVAVASVLVVGLYNRFSADRDLVFLFGTVSGLSALVLLGLLGAWELGLPGMAFILYIWKDIYIVLLVEIFWSFANSVFPKQSAQKTYGLFCVVGSVGGITGNLLVGHLAGTYGTQRSLLAVPFFLLFSWLGCRWLSRRAPKGGGVKGQGSSLMAGFQVLKSSRYLVWMLLLIAVTQVVINLIDFRYNALVEMAYPDTDARTAVIGQVYAAIDLASIGLQLGTGLVLGILGVAGALYVVPGLLCGTLLAHALLPGFAFMAVTKVASKALDYSIFRAAKEMLYLPLSHREKTQGKALVDVMTYRVAKGVVSLLLLVFVAIEARGLVLFASFVGIGIWLWLVRVLTVHYREAGGEQGDKPRPAGKPVSAGLGAPWLKRMALHALVFFGCLFTLNFLLQGRWASRWIADFAADQIAAATGDTVEIEGASAGIFPPQLSLTDLVLSHAGHAAVAAERVRVVFGFTPSGIGIDVLELHAPRVALHFEDGVLRELPGLAWYKEDSPAEELAWQQLVVHNGNISLEVLGAEQSSGRLRISGFEILPDLGDAGSNLLLDELEIVAGGVSQVAEDVRVLSARIGASGVDLQEISLAFDLLEIGGSFSYRISGGELGGDLQARVNLEDLGEIAPDLKGLQGDLELDLSLSGPVTSPLVVGAVLGEPRFIKSTGSIREFGEVKAAFEASSTGVMLTGLTSEWPMPGVVVDANLGWDGEVRKASLRAEDQRFAEVWEVATGSPRAFVDFQADAEVELSGRLVPLFLEGTVDFAVADIVVAPGPISERAPLLKLPWANYLGRVVLEPDGLTLETDQIRSVGLEGAVRGRVGWGQQAGLDLNLDLARVDLRQIRPFSNLRLEGVGSVRGRIHGAYKKLKINTAIDVSDFGMLGFRWADRVRTSLVADNIRDLEFRAFRAQQVNTTLQGNATVHLRKPLTIETDILVEDGHISDLVGIFLPIPGLDGRVDGTLSLAGEPLNLSGEARLDFRDIDFFGERFPEGNALGLMQEGLLTVDQLLLQRHGGAESLMTRGRVGRGYALNLEIIGDGFALERLDLLAGAKSPIRGSLLLDGTVGGTLFAPEPQGRLALQRTRLLGEPASASLLKFETSEGKLGFTGNLLGSAGEVSGHLGLNTTWDYQADGVLTQLPWHLVYARAADGQPLRGTADGRFEVSGAWGDPSVQSSEALELSRVDGAWRGHFLESLSPWHIQRRDGVITLDGLRLKGGSTDIRLDGEFGESWVDLTGGGEFDLELLEAATSHIGRAEGVGRVSFEQKGDRQVTTPEVVVEVEDALFETPWFPHPFESFSGRVYGGPTGYRFEELRGRLGGGKLTGEGRLDATDWTPTRFDLGANLLNGTVQYLDYLPPMRGNAGLRFDGPLESLLLSGDIQLLDMVFGETIQWEEWVIDIREERLNVVDEVEGAEGLFSFDLSVSGDQSIHVSNNIAEGTCDARLRFIGNTTRPGLSGWVRMDPGGRFTLQGRDFEVLRAELHYLEPWTFDPELDFLLQADVRSREDNYRIDYQVAGPFSGWNTQATSSPALSQGDINALLLFGMTRDELERFGGVNTALLVEGADLLLHGVGLEQVVSEGSGGLVDRVQVVTGISERGTVVSSEPRLVVEKRLGDSQGFDVIGEFNPNRPVDTYLGVERQLTEGLYVTFYRSGLEEDHGMELGGAYGADFKVRWDWD